MMAAGAKNAHCDVSPNNIIFLPKYQSMYLAYRFCRTGANGNVVKVMLRFVFEHDAAVGNGAFVL